MEKYLAVTCIGRQPESDVYVLGRNTQFTMKGFPICEDQQEFVWVDEILSKIAISIEELTYIHCDDHKVNIDKLITTYLIKSYM